MIIEITKNLCPTHFEVLKSFIKEKDILEYKRYTTYTEKLKCEEISCLLFASHKIGYYQYYIKD